MTSERATIYTIGHGRHAWADFLSLLAENVELAEGIMRWIIDTHGDLQGGLEYACGKTDKPVAALIKDLKQRGLLDSTLIVWGGEFGRLPISQGDGKPGRDHGPSGT